MTSEDIMKLAKECGKCLELLDWHIKLLVQQAVEAEREACAQVVEADGLARGNEGLVLVKAAGRIRARGEK